MNILNVIMANFDSTRSASFEPWSNLNTENKGGRALLRCRGKRVAVLFSCPTLGLHSGTSQLPCLKLSDVLRQNWSRRLPREFHVGLHKPAPQFQTGPFYEIVRRR